MPVRLLLLLAATIPVLLLGGCRSGPRAGAPAKPPPAVAETILVHVVVAGETISHLAQAYGITVERLIAANRLGDHRLHAGQRLLLPGATPLPLAPVPPPRPMGPSTDWYLPRLAWTHTAIDLSNIDAMGSTPWRITIHHSSDDLADNAINPIKALNDIERMHRAGKRNGVPFACIGYHFVISADGQVWEGRPIQYQGAHALRDNNKGNIGICLLGNFERHGVAPAQRAQLLAVLDRLCQDYAIIPGPTTVAGHKDHPGNNTDCPGRFLEPIVREYASGRLRGSAPDRAR